MNALSILSPSGGSLQRPTRPTKAPCPATLAALVLCCSVAVSADISLLPEELLKVKPPVQLRATPFLLSDVRLLESPFEDAMQRDLEYLLSLDPDRLLHTFRLNAGLASKAQPLGGWENPKIEVRGHFAGHYLSACALMFAASGDTRLKERTTIMVQELAKCQEALGPSGYLSAFPESFIDRVETTGKVWAPYYTLHKIQAGLLDAYVWCDNRQALALARRFGDWVKARNDRLTDEQLEKMLGVEHGGINESMANLYALTGDIKYLEAARRLFHKRVLEPLAAQEDKLAGLHANTQFPKVIGLARLYEVAGAQRDHRIAQFFWDRVVNHHSYVTGSNSDREHFGPPDQLSNRVSPFAAETCNTYNMLRLTRHLFAWDAAPAAADYYERALYNHILPSQDPRTGMMAYHVPLQGGWFMPYNTREDSFWCCTGTGVENHAKYGDSIYWHDADGLWVSLFIPSELSWRRKGVTLRQETRYPEEETVRLIFTCEEPVALAVRVRRPAWAQRGFSVSVNGTAVPQETPAGSFLPLHRTWKTGDRVEVRMPMDLRLESMPDNADRAAIFYGPIVLAGALGTNGIRPPMPYAKDQGDFFKDGTPLACSLRVKGRPVSEWVERAGGALTFRIKGAEDADGPTLQAFYLLPPQRYTIYWDLLEPATP